MDTIEIKPIDSHVLKVSVTRPYEGEAVGFIDIGIVTIDIGYVVVQKKRTEGGEIIEANCFIDEDEYNGDIRENLVNSIRKSLSQKIGLLVRFKLIQRNNEVVEIFVKA